MDNSTSHSSRAAERPVWMRALALAAIWTLGTIWVSGLYGCFVYWVGLTVIGPTELTISV